MSDYRKKDKQNPAKWIALAVVLLMINPAVLFPLAFFGGIAWLIGSNLKKQQSTPGSAGRTPVRSSPRQTATHYTTRQNSFDECTQSFFCRHKDKAIHHVRRGKEIDPWDRPDIDISKYQRKH